MCSRLTRASFKPQFMGRFLDQDTSFEHETPLTETEILFEAADFIRLNASLVVCQRSVVTNQRAIDWLASRFPSQRLLRQMAGGYQ